MGEKADKGGGAKKQTQKNPPKKDKDKGNMIINR